MAKSHTVAAAPDNPVIICWLGTNAGGGDVGEGHIPPGFGAFFGISFATAGNTEANSITPKIPITVVKPNKKDFRFDLGSFLASEKFSLSFWAPFLIFVVLFFILLLAFLKKRESVFWIFTVFKRIKIFKLIILLI
jgi:hypothetical protein